MDGVIISRVSNMLLLRNVQKIRFCDIPLLQRSFNTNQTRFFYEDNSKTFQNFKLKQARMQCDDGLPVYLKSGTRDKILFNFTLALLLCNTIASIYGIREMFRKF
ncbi:Cytochrome c oxidase subunit 7A2, mitochondrial [Formica fusca]